MLSSANSPTHAKAVRKPASPIVRDKWAVLIGIAKYQDNAIEPLQFAKRNALSIANVLKDPTVGRFLPSHVVSLVDTQATQGEITDVLSDTWLVRKALPNDLVVLYISCRMVPAKDGHDLIMLPYDAMSNQIERTGISLVDTLNELHRRIQSRHILCMLDTAISTEQQKATIDLEELSKITKVSILGSDKSLASSNNSDTNRMSYFAFYLKEALSVAQGTGPWSIVSQCVIQGAQSDAQREQAKVQIPQMAIAPDSEDLKDISLGIPIKYPDSFIGIHVGHPVDDLALTRPDLVLSGSPNGNRSVASETDESAAPPDALDKKFSSVDFGPYLAKMRKDIQAKWSPPKGYEDRHILTTFSISYDGYISDPEILEGSGIDPVDESALEALRSVSPLDPLPKGLPKSVQVRYQFDGRTKPE